MCTQPLAALPCGRTDTGKIKYKVVSYRGHFGDNVPEVDRTILPYNRGRLVPIPCGKCTECKMNYAKRWSDRCILEMQLHKSNYFLTLTYDDDHLPVNDQGFPTLRKKDYQDFMKRLRKSVYPTKLRFYMSGEYGTQTRRPHYHAIIFGLELNDLEFYSRTELGDILYNSPKIRNLWKNGEVVIGQVTPSSCAYVARYVMKKQGNEKRLYEKLNIVPEYTDMSRRPGIGKEAYTPSIFEKGYVCVSTETGGLKIYPPKYFEQFYDKDHHWELLAYKNHKLDKMYDKAVMLDQQTSKTYYDTFEDKKINIDEKSHAFVRDL